MYLIVTRSFPPEIGGMQNLMWGLTYSLAKYDLVKLNNYELNLNLLTATTLSFAFSLTSITFMMSWIKKYSFTPFIIYRLLLGTILLLAIYFW